MAGTVAPQDGNLPTPTITITLDDGYSCQILAPPFLTQSGFISHSFANRPLHSTSHTLYLFNTRRDFWLIFQHSILYSHLPTHILPPLLYKGRPDMASANHTSIRIVPFDCALHQLIELYIIGESLQAPAFLDTVMQKLMEGYKMFYEVNEGRVPLGSVEYVFENEGEGCLGAFVADVVRFGVGRRVLGRWLGRGI
ncbi:hypothetical protein L207DRAFT_585315 [Hyaloscypha variabilis F]|uniref:Uncharacterized protein n=1 Tax=Hyaloscypha variabilis (strain UAMH 11265 / GT02V1 / F) TaxID=1149755 RepID=A0A2J6RIV1_HYAVF|nr:hypothetical protein L207DRAFT_585315 [Hyaloscypha variabilis F]